MRFWISILALIYLLFATVAHGAQTITLVDKTWQFVENYNTEINRLVSNSKSTNKAQIGDTIIIGDQAFSFQGFLGQGTTTVVFAINKSEAIRVPRRLGIYNDEGRTTIYYTDFIDFTLRGYAHLKDSPLRVSRVYVNQSRPGVFAKVAREKVYFTLQDMVTESVRFEDWTLEFREKAINDFLNDFLPRTAGFTKIADLHEGQVAYTDNGWVILDYGLGAKRAIKIDDPTIVEGLFGYGRFFSRRFKDMNLIELSNQIIREEREKNLDLKPTVKQSLLGICRRAVRALL